jgi:arginine decarboxylase
MISGTLRYAAARNWHRACKRGGPRRTKDGSTPLKIRITTGTGEGPTSIAAFDAALHSAGVANYNLICLSSSIPTGSRLERVRFQGSADEYGYRLYVVMARADQEGLGQQAWAGLGWVQEQDSGRGIFVEAHGETKSRVTESIEKTLRPMMDRRQRSYGPIEIATAGIDCRDQPVCALVVAVYESEGWS